MNGIVAAVSDWDFTRLLKPVSLDPGTSALCYY